ncbi:unnamed protein product [Rotaria socialis]|uniref:Uncharacterized protein n=1 Tax=Rotaria socialis TaxID=392032 RepID=A0A817YI47_9BILA|nr:unnamed protein product [Rotaria socialis]CAF3382251.1 unnamed protein product [Rotaria socialis]CAF3399546.1 unnamed protein product [Rotaria socialis]CAF3418491.1 unnamed protein product [Rotaria socialis]CAF3787733.1 unnamed protein product [Rotaria socialis]
MNKILPIVNIGTKSGKFKYILAQLGQKYIVRGDPKLDFHEKIFKQLQDEAGGPKNDLYILGGGKMQVDFEKKKINLFDQSAVYGPADHRKSKTILQEEYPDFTIVLGPVDPNVKK